MPKLGQSCLPQFLAAEQFTGMPVERARARSPTGDRAGASGVRAVRVLASIAALAMIIKAGHKVVAVTAVRPEEAVSVNSREQLSDAGKIMQRRIQKQLMENGVTIVDPPNTWIDALARPVRSLRSIPRVTIRRKRASLPIRSRAKHR